MTELTINHHLTQMKTAQWTVVSQMNLAMTRMCLAGNNLPQIRQDRKRNLVPQLPARRQEMKREKAANGESQLSGASSMTEETTDHL